QNKLCNSCASQVKLKRNAVERICLDDDLEFVQQRLIQDLNLADDSDYEAELNYLKEAKRAAVLEKEKNKLPLVCCEGIECLTNCRHDQFEKLQANTKTLARNSVSELSYEVKNKMENVQVKDSLSNFTLADKCSIRRSPQPPKRIPHRRVAINSSLSFSILSVEKGEESLNPLTDRASIAYRAFFRPTLNREEPRPQFEKIANVECDSITKSDIIPHIGNRNPFICPVTFCRSIIPVSDLIKHFKLNHIKVPIVPVTLEACTNLCWEAKLDQFGVSQCLMLLLSHKGKEFGSVNLNDCLPVAVMTTKIKLSELTEVECEEDRRHFYLVWLTAMSSSMDPVYYTITAWSGAQDARVHVVNSTQCYSIRDIQSPKNVYGSGMVMILTSEQIKRLSNNNQEMIKLQVVVH
ncbi:hypothetical protein Bhyg_05802, partial [Pseudolycoriella hygida]